MLELKKVLSGHLGQVVFLAGKVPVKAHLQDGQGFQGSVYRPKIEDPNPEDAIIRDTERIWASCCSLPRVKLQNEDPILFVSLGIW